MQWVTPHLQREYVDFSIIFNAVWIISVHLHFNVYKEWYKYNMLKPLSKQPPKKTPLLHAKFHCFD